jgi:hypothetical protein
LPVEQRLNALAERFSGVAQWVSPTEAHILTTRHHVEQEGGIAQTTCLAADFRRDYGLDTVIVAGIADAANDALSLVRHRLRCRPAL